jgi:hypothetical protein
VASRRKKYSEEQAFELRHHALDVALAKYYAKNNLIEYYPLQELSLVKMRKITNFDAVARRIMKETSLHPKYFGKLCIELFKKFKEDPLLINEKQFKLFQYPKFKIVTNNLTVEQEEMVSKCIDEFYQRTNAGKLLNDMKFDMIENSEESEDELKEKFYNKYLAMNNKKHDPFHNLFFFKNESQNLSEIDEIMDTEPTSSDIQFPQNFAYKRRTMIERNEPKAASETTRENPLQPVVIESIENIAIVQKSLRDFSNLQVQQNEIIFEISKNLAQEVNFLRKMKTELMTEYPHDFENVYPEIKKQKLLYNFIYTRLQHEPDKLKSMIEACGVANMEELHKQVDEYKKGMIIVEYKVIFIILSFF